MQSNFITECAANCSFSDNLVPLGVPFILLAMVHPFIIVLAKVYKLFNSLTLSFHETIKINMIFRS